jgi:hypothetical protein
MAPGESAQPHSLPRSPRLDPPLHRIQISLRTGAGPAVTNFISPKVPPLLSRLLRQGGDFDFREADDARNVKFPALSPSRTRGQGRCNLVE